mmetsp:Transcript_38818/g.62872  ORF Transcript_38818/g.62872 Transcript_38818/m.62872 type:complete len:120 (-) Transcript_38818:585-944(-)
MKYHVHPYTNIDTTQTLQWSFRNHYWLRILHNAVAYIPKKTRQRQGTLFLDAAVRKTSTLKPSCNERLLPYIFTVLPQFLSPQEDSSRNEHTGPSTCANPMSAPFHLRLFGLRNVSAAG